MKKILLPIILVIAYLGASAQSNDIVIGKIDSINSTILDEQRKLWVYVPKGNDDSLYAEKKYPVVYLLDGDAHFYPMVGMIHQLSTVNGNTVCPEMIVVGIPNTNRTRDLTPSKPEAADNPFIGKDMLKVSGGGEKFISFLADELIPHIDSKYPTEPYKIFVGHSLGGLMVMHTLLHKPELFNAYVAIDPSMWWDSDKLLTEIEATTLGKKYREKTLCLSIANTMDSGMDTTKVKEDSSPMTGHIRALLRLNAHLHQNHGELDFMGKYYPDDSHGSLPFIAGYDAFRYLFQDHQLKLGPADYMNPETDLAGKIETHYTNLSELFGYPKKPAEDFLNSMGYQFMNMNMLDKAEQIFLLNVKYYPERYNVYDSLADLYAKKGENKKAIKNYKKALSLNEKLTYTQSKLEKLQNK